MFNTIKDFALESVTALLAFFYSLPVVGGSYGLAIIMLTMTVMVVLMPLTLKATRSTIKMTQLQPELKALQKKHKDDKQELNQAMMALYQENGVNPVGGCLPMLAQLPVFLVLFNVLRGLTRRVSELPYYAVAEQARAQTGAEASAGNTFDPRYLDHETELYKDLSAETEMLFGPFDLARDAWDVVQTDFLRSLVYIVLILFVVGTSYYQQRQISARRGSQPDNPTPQQQTQQQLLKILPLMSGVWSFLFPAGLVLYWATSNLFRIGQQAYITRALYKDEDDPLSGVSASSSLVDSDSESKAESKSNGSAQKTSSKKASNKSSNQSSKADTNGGTSVKAGARSGGKTKSANKNGSDSDSGSNAPADRNAAWERRRAQKTKTQQAKKAAADGSSRTTPKGTKPSGQKKKRKR